MNEVKLGRVLLLQRSQIHSLRQFLPPLEAGVGDGSGSFAHVLPAFDAGVAPLHGFVDERGTLFLPVRPLHAENEYEACGH